MIIRLCYPIHSYPPPPPLPPPSFFQENWHDHKTFWRFHQIPPTWWCNVQGEGDDAMDANLLDEYNILIDQGSLQLVSVNNWHISFCELSDLSYRFKLTLLRLFDGLHHSTKEIKGRSFPCIINSFRCKFLFPNYIRWIWWISFDAHTKARTVVIYFNGHVLDMECLECFRSKFQEYCQLHARCNQFRRCPRQTALSDRPGLWSHSR